VGRAAGVTEAKLADLARYRESDAFTDDERLVIEYAEAMTATPVAVPDELFARLRARFDPAELVELTASIAWENFRARFNHALEVEAQGFSAGAFCPLPDRAK
jgi:alkylhydroperoxidase family enzyme